MKVLCYQKAGKAGIAVSTDENNWMDISAIDSAFPIDIATLLQDKEWRKRTDAIAKKAPSLELSDVAYLPPIRNGEKILCVGLNYRDHVGESPYEMPSYPVFFPRFASTLIGHLDPLVRPVLSTELDYEGEIVVVIGKAGRHIKKEAAVSHVAGYTLFNEASVRNFQFKAPQWTMGKNFDNTGASGPWFVTADELPEGAAGLRLETRVNGLVEQSANTNDMIFKITDLITIASEVMTLRPGDMIVSGTPAGVGFGKKPPVYLKPGDVCEISVEGIGKLENPVIDEEI